MMSLDKDYVCRGAGGSGDEEAVRLKMLYCNFRYVYYTHPGMLIQLGRTNTTHHTCMHEHVSSSVLFPFFSFGDQLFFLSSITKWEVKTFNEGQLVFMPFSETPKTTTKEGQKIKKKKSRNLNDL